MLSKYFFTALKKITAHAQNFLSTLYVFDYKRNEDGLSELKILVSVVRFRPGPPRITIAHLLGYSLLVWRMSVVDQNTTNHADNLANLFAYKT